MSENELMHISVGRNDCVRYPCSDGCEGRMIEGILYYKGEIFGMARYCQTLHSEVRDGLFSGWVMQ